MTTDQLRSEAVPLLAYFSRIREEVTTGVETTFPVGSVVAYRSTQNAVKFGRVRAAYLLADEGTLEVWVDIPGGARRFDPLKEELIPATEADLTMQEQSEAKRKARKR